MPSMKTSAIVLCGGKSSRMGRPKALLPWFGRTMIEHVVGELTPVVDHVWVVTSKDLALPPLAARIVEDREPARGPLAGIRDGLEAAGSDLAFVTSTDAPFLKSEFVERMLSRGEALAPRAEGHIQVLSAVYPGSAWKEADALLSRGVGRPLRLLESVGYEALDLNPAEWGGGVPWRGFNTPEEYLASARELAPDATAEVELLGRAALEVDERRFRVPIGTLGEILARLSLPDSLRLVESGRLAKSHLISLGGRELVRDLDLPIGPGERVSVIDALAGG